jgi:hypothetical protein
MIMDALVLKKLELRMRICLTVYGYTTGLACDKTHIISFQTAPQSYLDVLAFLPHKAEHRSRLQHDFARYFAPVDTDVGGTTLINKYNAGDADITQAIRDV